MYINKVGMYDFILVSLNIKFTLINVLYSPIFSTFFLAPRGPDIVSYTHFKRNKKNNFNGRQYTFWEKYPLLNFIFLLQKLCNRNLYLKAWKTIYERPPRRPHHHHHQPPSSHTVVELEVCTHALLPYGTLDCALWSPAAASCHVFSWILCMCHLF